MDRMAEELPHEVAKEDKRVALLISVLALSLAIVETGANSAQTEAISGSVQTTDTWSFYQARTIRQTTVRTAAELAELTKPGTDPAARAAIEAQQKTWRDMANRWDDDPKGGDGRKQLAERARLLEGSHETAMARYHLYEYGAALIQVAIVVASASIITAVPLLTVGSIVLGLGGAALGLIGWLAPQAVHF
jgi:hypothetical protein